MIGRSDTKALYLIYRVIEQVEDFEKAKKIVELILTDLLEDLKMHSRQDAIDLLTATKTKLSRITINNFDGKLYEAKNTEHSYLNP